VDSTAVRQCSVRQCGSVRQCARQFAEVRTVVCTQCARQGAAVRLVVYGSAAVRVWQCGSVQKCVAVIALRARGRVWQCLRAAVCGSVCGSVAVCGSAYGSALIVYNHTQSRSQYISMVMPLNKRRWD
jgi:hypothetical protein